MKKLKCEACGGPLTMQSGGEMAVCEYCGMRYSRDRVREMVQEIRGKVEIEGVVKTSAADFEIHAGVLTKYHGADMEIVIPDGVKEIQSGCFPYRQYITAITLPNGLERISNDVFSGSQIANVHFPESLTYIGNSVFSGSQIVNVHFPESLTYIGNSAFSGCQKLETINIPNSVTYLGNGAFAGCVRLKNVEISDSTFQRLCPQMEEDHSSYIVISNTLTRPKFAVCWRWYAFSSSIITFPIIPEQKSQMETAPAWFQKVAMQKYAEIEKVNRENWKRNNRCQYCGGTFEGIFTKICCNCGKIKDF